MQKNALKNAYAANCAGFNSVIRYIVETAREREEKTPAAPEKGDNTPEAKALREAAKNIKKRNALIADCKSIVETWAITAAGLKRDAIKELRSRILAAAPYRDAAGSAVTFATLPKYLQTEYKNARKVVPADWVTAICDATDNAAAENPINVTLEPTQAPAKVDDEWQAAAGNIVDINGNVLPEQAAILARWDVLAPINADANAAGSAAKSDYLAANCPAK